ncbi:DUF1150 domain-containing protein [Roseovarius aestuarii]|nr:DUF1150 domain-containing protein [Roseovarius aestuarii]
METKYDFAQDTGPRIAYVRPVNVKDLPDDMQAQVQEQLAGLDTIYAVHSAEGERLALVKDRALAFVLARQNDLTPVTVH